MTDRELLELAGKALCGYGPAAAHRLPDEFPVAFTYQGKPWNPLEDDGDALRLAVSLCLIVSCDASPCIAVSSERHPSIHIVESAYGGDVQQATRRAIVRVAAKIGSRM